MNMSGEYLAHTAYATDEAKRIAENPTVEEKLAKATAILEAFRKEATRIEGFFDVDHPVVGLGSHEFAGLANVNQRAGEFLKEEK